MKQRWLFRVASAPNVGGGHMNRCLSLARAMVGVCPSVRGLGDVSIVFVLDHDGDAWTSTVRKHGFDAVTEDRVPPLSWSGVLVDGYAFTPAYVQSLKDAAHGAPLVVLDDFANTVDPADLVINPGCRMQGDSLAGKDALLGPSFALLDEAYGGGVDYLVGETVRNVLVSFGRVDSKNATALALEALRIVSKQGMRFATEVVLGGQAPNLESVEAALADFPLPAALACDVDDMVERLRKSDIVIGGGGVNLLERLAVGTPGICVIQSENQLINVTGASDDGAVINAGKLEDVTAERLAEHIHRLMNDFALRQALSRKGRALVDGQGAERVARKLLSLAKHGEISSA